MSSVLDAIDVSIKAFEQHRQKNWVIGFSGGKDSTALLKVLCAAYIKAKTKPQNIAVIYCDTGVENVLLDSYIKRLFGRLKKEFRSLQVPLSFHLLRAPVSDRFFVKIIGRGYPPPTNNFRWCTKNLRIKPVEQFIAKSGIGAEAVVSLGMRMEESEQRKRSLLREGGGYWQKHEAGRKSTQLFLPIMNLSVSDVWDVIYGFPRPKSIRPAELESLYRDASGECPILKSPVSPPCGSGRFGCWTCTVVRKDHSALKMIDAGHNELLPYLEFRNWLSEIRNDPSRRWPERRNGSEGLGPFTLKARKEIYNRVINLQRRVDREILSTAELRAIYELWELDRGDEPI